MGRGNACQAPQVVPPFLLVIGSFTVALVAAFDWLADLLSCTALFVSQQMFIHLGGLWWLTVRRLACQRWLSVTATAGSAGGIPAASTQSKKHTMDRHHAECLRAMIILCRL